MMIKRMIVAAAVALASASAAHAQTSRVVLVNAQGQIDVIANAPDLLPDRLFISVANPAKKKATATPELLMLPPAGAYHAYVRLSVPKKLRHDGELKKLGDAIVVYIEEAR